MSISARATTTREDGSREWVYPRDIPGKWHFTHRGTSLLLHAWLILGPWLTIGGERLVHIDVPGRHVWVFGTMFTASDGALLMLMGLLAGFSLFFFTSIFGRLWCGYLCPHSVFLINWVLPIEEWIEGGYRDRIKRDDKGFSMSTTLRKAAKFALFGAVAGLVSMSFMGFFTDPRALWTGQAGVGAYGVVAFFSGLWLFDFAYFREQTCNFICPYARFQGALMDDHSLTVTYDTDRGDPRGGKGAADANRCLDCNWCVQVCPQGIDIRDGFQLECISCGRCVDACASVMAKARPGNTTLIDYNTLAADRGETHKRIRPRTVVYAGILAALVVAMALTVGSRAPFEISVNRTPGSLFQVDADGSVRNTFLLRVVNTSTEDVQYEVFVEGLDGHRLTAPPVALAPEETRQFPMVVQLGAEHVRQRTYPIVVRVDNGSDTVRWNTTFKTPGPMEP